MGHQVASEPCAGTEAAQPLAARSVRRTFFAGTVVAGSHQTGLQTASALSACKEMCCVMVERQAYMACAESATPAGVILCQHG